MKQKIILVTGSAGFMGSWLVNELLNRKHLVIGIDNLSGGNNSINHKNYIFHKIDLRNFDELENIFDDHNPEIIFHLAAYAAEGQSIYSPAAINDINLRSMNNLLVNAVNYSVERFVFTSSMAVYGTNMYLLPFEEDSWRLPEDPYGCGKAYCERMLEIFYKLHGLEYCILRPHNVYGERQNITDPYRNVLGIWINQIMRNKRPTIYGDGRQTRAFSYIKDITSALANAGFYERAKNEIINLGNNEIVSINQACELLLAITESKLKPKYLPARKEVKDAYCTIEKSKRLLDYKIKYNLERGLENMWKWAKKVGPKEPTYTLPIEIEKGCPKIWLNRGI